MNTLSELESSQSSEEPTVCTPSSFLPLTAAFKKSQHLLDFTIDALLKRLGVARVLFVTLTFEEHIRSTEVGQQKLNSLLNAVRKRHGGYLWVLETQASGRIHYHLLVPVGFDCHDGTDLDAWHKDSYPMDGQYFYSEDPDRCGVCTRETYLRNSMNPALQVEDDWWQDAAKAHGFGRVQVAPIYGGADAIRKYMTKQDWRSRPWPFVERKNVRFWSCSQSVRAGCVKFAWNSKGAQLGRQRLAAWAAEHGCDSLDDLACVLGPQWGYRYHCEVVWPERRKQTAAPEYRATCAFPARRYNDPAFQFHPGLYGSPEHHVVTTVQPVIPPSPSSERVFPAVSGGAGDKARASGEALRGPLQQPPGERQLISAGTTYTS